MYQYNEDVIKKTLQMIISDINQQFKQFDLYLPQSLAYVKRIIPQQQNVNLDKPYVFVLGMTRVGKSTLLNILNNPENIIINQDKKFDVKQKNNKILLSHSNSSSTFQMEYLEIGNFIFVDSPGLHDTDDTNRCINHINIFNSITRVSQQILLLMIDGEQLQTTKNDLIDSITLINNMLGDQQDDKYLENFIIPVFTKIRNASTMEQIIKKWQTETMKDITDQKQLNILKIIKNAIDQENYIKIYSAERYEIHEEMQQLESEIQRMQTQYFKKKKDDKERQVLEEQIQLKQEELDKLNQEGLFQKKIQNIKEDVLGKCKNLLERKEKILKEKQDIVLNFELKLTPELKYHIEKLLTYRQKFYQHLLNNITNEFITKMLFDNSISLNDKESEIFQTLKIKMNRLSDIPKELINQNIQDQINELNQFNNIILKYDHWDQDPQKVDFQYFQIQLRVLKSLFIGIDYTSIFQYTILPFILITTINYLFNNSIFVTQKEKEKQEKMKMLNIQQKYISILEKTRK
ncbi:unnamed protein product (macronuclear) [Paramecium tetraurelia]|uniref:G domain-containing protein n=1 Tax=Paramecium tetraurelia TaxID=5888 RepID=A0BG77_PARTE|nr:uncharacterized protein GSPATT00028579001 [Paramecium tetraurelia]CAK57544.1 unnamed protein product [Paramecium tetraurelia]|eukprot:XP_001424942.1 hypothetical protein (macronuclear) [Paramecium tetraurelia strain d4-2]